MTEGTAADKADDVIKLMLQHQENPFGWNPLNSEESAKRAARLLGAFRAELIAQLVPQK